MRKHGPVVLWLSGIALLLATAACESSDHRRDVENVSSRQPDLVELFANINEHPNIAKVCIDGVAFATTTRQHAPIQRVEAWDRTCPAGQRR